MFDIESIPISDVDKKRKITFPKKPSKELAEFIGILTGDGYMNRYGKYFHLVEIAGDSRHDKEYIINYVCPMIKNLFNLIPKIIFRKDQNTMYIRIMSKGLFEYLFYMGFKYGKKGEIGIPNWIIEDEVFFISFIKGLADTDFSLVLLNRNQKKYLFYPRISVGLKSKNLIQILEAKFKELNFSTTTQYDALAKDSKGTICRIHRIHINGRNNLEKWMNLISFRNERHLSKYRKLKSGTRGI